MMAVSSYFHEEKISIHESGQRGREPAKVAVPVEECL